MMNNLAGHFHWALSTNFFITIPGNFNHFGQLLKVKGNNIGCADSKKISNLVHDQSYG
jgi:hypothetical protein